jgi:hypothetical protein
LGNWGNSVSRLPGFNHLADLPTDTFPNGIMLLQGANHGLLHLQSVMVMTATNFL